MIKRLLCFGAFHSGKMHLFTRLKVQFWYLLRVHCCLFSGWGKGGRNLRVKGGETIYGRDEKRGQKDSQGDMGTGRNRKKIVCNIA